MKQLVFRACSVLFVIGAMIHSEDNATAQKGQCGDPSLPPQCPAGQAGCSVASVGMPGTNALFLRNYCSSPQLVSIDFLVAGVPVTTRVLLNRHRAFVQPDDLQPRQISIPPGATGWTLKETEVLANAMSVDADALSKLVFKEICSMPLPCATSGNVYYDVENTAARNIFVALRLPGPVTNVPIVMVESALDIRLIPAGKKARFERIHYSKFNNGKEFPIVWAVYEDAYIANH